MRHQISPNQTVLWPHHELTEAWAPTGIRPPLKTGVGTEGREAGECAEQDTQAVEPNRGLDPEPAVPNATALTRTGGMCGQVGRMARRRRQGPRRGELPGSRRATTVGLI